jgi:hypothetical protein
MILDTVEAFEALEHYGIRVASKPLHFKARLDPHAHDRKGYGFHPDPVTTPRRC